MFQSFSFRPGARDVCLQPEKGQQGPRHRRPGSVAAPLWCRPLWLATLLLAGCGDSAPLPPVELQVSVTGVRSDTGTLRAMLCERGEAFPDHCRRFDWQPARAGTAVFRYSMPPGDYAFAVFHDEDGDQRVSMREDGLPAEGVAFSRDAMGANGPPNFSQAKFSAAEGSRIRALMRYWE